MSSTAQRPADVDESLQDEPTVPYVVLGALICAASGFVVGLSLNVMAHAERIALAVWGALRARRSQPSCTRRTASLAQAAGSAENVEHARGGMYYCRACAVEFDAIVFDLSKPDSPLPKGHPDHRDDWR